jgi:hypothetical protein
LRHEPVDQVLLMTAELLSRPDTYSVDVARVRLALGWPEDRREEVLRLLVQLVEEGYLRGPRNADRGGLRGDNRILDVDVLGVTPRGRERLAQASEPQWRRAGGWTVGRIRVLVGAVIVAVAVTLAVGFAKQWAGLR